MNEALPAARITAPLTRAASVCNPPRPSRETNPRREARSGTDFANARTSEICGEVCGDDRAGIHGRTEAIPARLRRRQRAHTDAAFEGAAGDADIRGDARVG